MTAARRAAVTLASARNRRCDLEAGRKQKTGTKGSLEMADQRKRVLMQVATGQRKERSGSEEGTLWKVRSEKFPPPPLSYRNRMRTMVAFEGARRCETVWRLLLRKDISVEQKAIGHPANSLVCVVIGTLPNSSPGCRLPLQYSPQREPVKQPRMTASRMQHASEKGKERAATETRCVMIDGVSGKALDDFFFHFVIEL